MFNKGGFMETRKCPMCKQTIYGKQGTYTCLKCGIFKEDKRTLKLERSSNEETKKKSN